VTYDQIIEALQVLGAIPLNSEDTNFQRIVPAMFHYADGRIYRELAFLATDVITPVPLTAMEREVALPLNILTVRSIGVCSPSGAPSRNSRRFYPERISPEALDLYWPQPNFKPAMPRKYALIGTRVPPSTQPNPSPPGTQPLPPIYFPETFSYVVRFMPSPDRAYTMEVFGGVEPEILSPTNPETFLSRYYNELFIACCMVYITGYQRDYGAQADDPQRAVSWEGQYQTLKAGVASEAGRLRGEGPGFTPLPPAQQAQQPRSP
jgi:hypothetical protein